MDSVSPVKVLEAFDKEAEKYKKYGSSYRRIMKVRQAVERELELTEFSAQDPIDSVLMTSNQVNVIEFEDAGRRFAEMIKHADECEDF